MPMIETQLQHNEIMPYFCRDEVSGGLGYRQTSVNIVSDDLFIPSHTAEFVKNAAPQVWTNLLKKFGGDERKLSEALKEEIKAKVLESSNVAVFFNRNKNFSFQGETVPLFLVSSSELSGADGFKKNIFAAVEELPHSIKSDGTVLQNLRPDITFFLNGIFIGYMELKSVTNGQSAAENGRGKVIADYLESVKAMAERGRKVPGTIEESARRRTLFLFEKGMHITTTDVNETYIIRNIASFYDDAVKGFTDNALTVGAMRGEVEKVFKAYPVSSKLLTNVQRFKEIMPSIYGKAAIEKEILYYNFLQYKYKGGAHNKQRISNRGFLISPRPKQKFGCDRIVRRVKEMLEHEADPNFYRNRLKLELESLGCTAEKVEEVLLQRDQYCNNKYVYSLLMQYAAGFGKSNIIGWTALQLKDIRHDGAWAYDKIMIVVDRLQLREQIDTMMMSMNIDKSMFTEVTNQTEFVTALTDTKRIIVVNIQKFSELQESITKAGVTLKNMRCAFLIDEIHRSNTGENHREMVDIFERLHDGFSANGDVTKKKNLIVGFTATPSERVLARFGEFKSASIIPTWVPFDAYTMKEAIQDGYVLDPTKHIIPVVSQLHFELPEGVDPDSDKALRLEKNTYYSNQDRMEKLAEFIVNRLVSLVYTKIHGTAKAMLAVSSIPIAISYCIKIRKFMEEKCKDSKYAKYAASPISIVYSDNQENESSASLNDGKNESKVVQDFRQAKNGLMIVVDKLQTGFDEPKLHTLFLDKEIKDINAIQTISRVNRTCKGKEECHIVDMSWRNVNVKNIKEACKKYEGIVISDFNPELARLEVETNYLILTRSEPYRRWFAQYRKQNNDAQFVLRMEDDIRQWIYVEFERTRDSKDIIPIDDSFMQIVNQAKNLYQDVSKYGNAITALENVLDIDKKYTEGIFLHFWEVYCRIYRDVMRMFRTGGGDGGITPDVIVDDIPGIIISEEVPEEDEDDKEHTKALNASDEHGVVRSLQEIIEEWNAIEELSKEIVQQWVAEIEKLFEYLRNNEMFIAVINDDNFPPNKKLEEYNKEIIKYQFRLSLKRDFQKVESFKKMLQDNGAQLLDVFICRMNSKTKQRESAVIFRDNEIDAKLRFVSFLPLYTLRAACGVFRNGDAVESEGWVNAEGTGRLDPTMFAVHAKGHSMEPMIHDGDICKMRKVGGGNYENKIVLVQHYNEVDSETGGEYSIKRFTRDGDKVILKSLNPDYEDIVIEDTADYSIAYRLIATFEGVIR